MIRFKGIFFLLPALYFLTSCGDSKTAPGPEISETYRELLLESNNLEKAVAQDRFFLLTARRDQEKIQSALNYAQFSLQKLSRSPGDSLGIELGLNAFREYQSSIIPRGEAKLLEDFFSRFGALLSEEAKKANIDLEGLSWRMLAEDFSDGFGYFTTFSSGNNWETGISLDKSHASVRGPQNEAWLISPLMDLSKIKNPSFRLLHQTWIDRDSRYGHRFNRNLINQTVFKAYASTKYLGGTPDLTNKAQGWKELDLGNMPASVDFHTTFSDFVDLSDFTSETTSIALVFHADPCRIGSHTLRWLINSFEVFGAGPRLPEFKERPPSADRSAPVASFDFSEGGLQGFQNKLIGTNAASWSSRDIPPARPHLRISGFNGRRAGAARLIGPKMTLEAQTYLTISQSINFYSALSGCSPPTEDRLLRILFVDTENNDEYEIFPSGLPAGTDWAIITSNPFLLPKPLANRPVRLVFEYSGDVDLDIFPSWDIHRIQLFKDPSLQLDEASSPWKLINGDDPNPDLDLDDDPSPSPKIIKKFDFSDGDLQDFTSRAIGPNAASWSSRTHNDNSYIRISGFVGKRDGLSRFISPRVELNGETALQIRHAINHYPQDQQERKLLRLFVRDTLKDKEYEIQITPFPRGDNWTAITSDYISLPSEVWETEIEIIFEYRGDKENDIFPSWDLHEVILTQAP